MSFTRTLWLVPLAAFVLKESVGPRRVFATIIGFLGALLMLQPQAQGNAGWPAVAALASALLLGVDGHRHEGHDARPLHAHVDGVVGGAGIRARDSAGAVRVALAQWPDLALLGAMGVLGVITQACYIQGMSEGDAATMAPIDYTRLVFAVILGYALFGDIPEHHDDARRRHRHGLHPLHHAARSHGSANPKPPPERVELVEPDFLANRIRGSAACSGVNFGSFTLSTARYSAAS